MMNYLNKPAPEMLNDVQMHTPEQEQMARSKGFPSYEAMLAWARQRNRPTGGTVAGAPARGTVTGGRPASESPNAGAAMAWHPKNIFEYVTRAMGGQ